MVNSMPKTFDVVESERATVRTAPAASGSAADLGGATCLQSDRPSSQTIMVARVIAEMKKQVNVNVTLPEWADYASVDKFELTAAFKKMTGIPPMMFHNAERLEMAKRLLVFERLSVTDTCFEIGFESLGSFVTKFTQSIQISPNTYARAMRDTSIKALFAATLLRFRKPPTAVAPATQLRFSAPPSMLKRSLIAAVFPRPLPLGYPRTWRFIPRGCDHVYLPRPLTGHCMVASMPSFPRLADLVNFRPEIVASVVLDGVSAHREVILRAPSIFDPPILLAVPILFCREMHAEAGGT